MVGSVVEQHNYREGRRFESYTVFSFISVVEKRKENTMNKCNFQKVVHTTMNNLNKGMPFMLSCCSAAGVVITTVFAVRATPKALRKIQTDSKKNHDGDDGAYTPLEAIRSAWEYYIPATFAGGITIFCIFSSNMLSKRQQMALTSAYAMLNDSYKNYKNKVKEIYGEEAHQKIIDSIIINECKDVYMSGQDIANYNSLDFDEHDPKDNRLFYDVFSKRYFESTINRVIQAEYFLNRDYSIGGNVSVNNFYGFLGLADVEGGDELEWCMDTGIYWIDFNHRKTILDDGLEVCVIEMIFEPEPVTLD